MALKKQNKRPINAIEVISKDDGAVDLEQSNWEEYAKTGDRSHLVFVEGEQPTIFLCNFKLKGKEARSIKNNMIGGKDDDGNPKISLGDWSYRVVKQTLKDIINPADSNPMESFVFKKDADGYVHDDLLAELDSLGMVDAIFGMYTSLTSGGARDNAKNS